ncbi:hypothetical protein ACFC58_12865 [Kitasatospora purpeofusca]|uniref:hypothetical protein n=1 Tax=Kitasatospora purpeofusca TaxID=67352 RepID=UPI0035DB238C
MTESTGTGRSEEELTKQVMPAILELQRVLVQGARRPQQPQFEAAAYVSITSCDHHSCGGGGGGGPTIM